MSCFRVVVMAGCLLAYGCSALAQVKLDAKAQYRTVADVLVLLDQIKPDPARVEAYRALLKKPLPPEDAFWFTKRDALVERMDAAENLGDVKARLAAADSIVQLFQSRQDRTREMEFAFNYAGLLRAAGLDAKANAVEDEMVKDPKSYAHWVMSHHNRKSLQLSGQGNLEQAQVHFEAATSAYQACGGCKSLPNTKGAYHWVIAEYKRAQGKFFEAQANYESAMTESARWVKDIKAISGTAFHALPSSSGYNAFLNHRASYARMLLDYGQLGQAERVAREPLLWSLERMGKYSHHAVRAAGVYAEVLSGQGRHVEAEKLSRAAVEMAQGIGADDESSFMRGARFALARALLGQGNFAQADAIFVDIQRPLDNLVSVAAVLNGRASAVLPELKLRAERSVANVGAGNPLTGEARGLYAMALAATGASGAGAEFAAALPGLLSARRQAGEAEEAIRVKTRQWILEAYLQHLSRTAATDSAAAAQSFTVADLLRGSSTQQAVAASAARASVNDPALAATVRKEQDLRAELVNNFRALQRLSTLSPEQLAEQNENPAALRARIDTVTREHSTLFADIEKRFPKYANLIDPKPPTLEQTRAALRPGEVLLSVLTTPERSFVWAVPHTGPVVFHASALGETGIAPIVKRLRSALDVGNLEASRWPAIDVAGAHQIYRELLQPVQATFGGAHTLIMAANNSLASLPPAVLVTAPTTLGKDKAVPFDRYLDVPWLDKQMATAQLPSVNALVSLRAAAPASAQRKAFAGFGDPVFAANATINAAPAATRGTGLRSAPTERLTEQTMREGKAVAWQPYSKLAPLPDTRDEVTAIAKALGADVAKDVVFGAQVTRQRVKQTDLSATRIVAFATHGLMAGDFPGLSQPALALSAPAGKDADKEPLEALLTLEDVLQLKMDADWVVLSACNTAAADGQGSEAVSGLGRGFFYAGSRALLVTHWSVDSESAKDLVSHTFTRYAQDPQITRAKALQAAMQHIRASTAKDPVSQASYSLAHPLFWAPYALVGEPGR
jgi:CHAT domain-containing protein/tetratricopeptide (TPR) repeat protein